MSNTVDVSRFKAALKWASFASTMSWITWVPRLPEIKDHLGLSLDQLGTILMVAGLTMAFAAKPTAALIHSFSSKRVILFGVVLCLALVGILVPRIVANDRAARAKIAAVS